MQGYIKINMGSTTHSPHTVARSRSWVERGGGLVWVWVSPVERDFRHVATGCKFYYACFYAVVYQKIRQGSGPTWMWPGRMSNMCCSFTLLWSVECGEKKPQRMQTQMQWVSKNKFNYAIYYCSCVLKPANQMDNLYWQKQGWHERFSTGGALTDAMK